MRSNRTNKIQRATRLSYADRVLEAVVTIRREQKKRAIHINTLRAQVRRTAELQETPLGPRWTAWVGRAVTKLENQGVLQEDCASGNICLTPRARKALNNVHRDVHTTKEEHLWKSINPRFLTPSTPSKRRRSSARGIHDDSDHEFLNTPTSRTKRSRKLHEGISGMSKAQEELVRLREVNNVAQAKLEAITRDAEDIETLRAELARRENEIERIHLDLNDTRNRSSALGDVTPRSVGYRSTEPPSSPTMRIGSALRDNQHDTLPPFRKRTLPASPVDDGSDSDDPFAPPDVNASPNSFLEFIQRRSTGSVKVTAEKSTEISTTPISGDPDLTDHVTDDHFWTPPQSIGERVEDRSLTHLVARLRQEIQGYQQEISDLTALQRERNATTASHYGVHEELERAEEVLRQARGGCDSGITDLQRRCAQLTQETEMYRLRIQAIESQQVQVVNAEIVSLRPGPRGSSAKVQEVESSPKQKELPLASLDHRSIDSGARLSTVLQDLDQVRRTISTLEQQATEKAEIAGRAALDRDLADAASLREQVRSLETAIIAERSAAVGLKDDLWKASERRDVFEAVANVKDQEILQLGQEIDALRREIGEYGTLKDELLAEMSGLKTTLDETKEQLSIAQEEASRSATSLAISQITQAGLLAQVGSLESSLIQHRAESTQELSNLRDAHALSLAEKQTRVSGLESSLAVAESSLSELQERLKTITLSMEEERNTLRSDISSLQRSLEESRGAAKRLESSRELLRLTLQNVTEELDGKRNEVDGLQARLTAEAQQSAVLTDALQEANGRVQGVEKKIATVEAAKKADEEIIRRATAGCDKLQKLHTECLAEMDGFVGMIRGQECG